jgi:aspartyl-tRNA(Asn)/glutamyl-tRNA(Gln) amidotransferase subunit C
MLYCEKLKWKNNKARDCLAEVNEMAISKEEVYKVAELARLKLSEEEAERFTSQLNDILEFANKLNELDTDHVEPTSHVLPMINVMREDEVRPSLDREKVLKNAPEHQDGMFRVPAVFEE